MVIVLRWGGYNEKMAEGIVKALVRIFRGKGSLILLAIAALAILGSAVDKWR